MLVDLLQEEAVPFEKLHVSYSPLLNLVRILIGVIPNCDTYLEIWPPAFRAYNVMVPNLLNLPFLLWGMGAPQAAVGLSMYVSSRAAGCPYCSAHTCSFALRRGATVDEVASALDDNPKLRDADRAAVRVARALSRIPVELTNAERADLQRHFSVGDIEWIVLSVAAMGWLNKTMDALGVPLEVSAVAEVRDVISQSGWTPGQHMREAPPSGPAPHRDSFLTKLRVLRYAPAAIALDRRWTSGVPKRWPEVGDFLRRATGHDFPVLSLLEHGRAVRAIATMIRDAFTEAVLPRDDKLAAGLLYAETVGNAGLANELRLLGARTGGNSALLPLARAIAPSPTAVDDEAMDAARKLPASGIIELVSFFALLQLLHRLSSFYQVPVVR